MWALSCPWLPRKRDHSSVPGANSSVYQSGGEDCRVPTRAQERENTTPALSGTTKSCSYGKGRNLSHAREPWWDIYDKGLEHHLHEKAEGREVTVPCLDFSPTLTSIIANRGKSQDQRGRSQLSVKQDQKGWNATWSQPEGTRNSGSKVLPCSCHSHMWACTGTEP